MGICWMHKVESFGKGSANNVKQNHLTGHAIAEFGDHRWLDVATNQSSKMHPPSGYWPTTFNP